MSGGRSCQRAREMRHLRYRARLAQAFPVAASPAAADLARDEGASPVVKVVSAVAAPVVLAATITFGAVSGMAHLHPAAAGIYAGNSDALMTGRDEWPHNELPGGFIHLQAAESGGTAVVTHHVLGLHDD